MSGSDIKVALVGSDRVAIKEALARHEVLPRDKDGCRLIVVNDREDVPPRNELMRSRNPRSDLTARSLLAAFAGLSGWPRPRTYYQEPPKPKKKCLNCPTMHDHNNSWCSAECCKAWRLKKKEEKKGG